MGFNKRSMLTISVIAASLMGIHSIVEASDETKVAQNTQQPVFSKEVRTGPAGENEMIWRSPVENYWWDTTHNQHFTFGSDYVSGPWLTINRTEGYLELSETLDLSEGWKFINITYKGQVYQVGDRIFDTDLIYDDNKTSKENDIPYEAAMNQLRYNYEPLEFNVRISYSGLPENVKATLPTTDATPILSGSMYKIPQAPKVAGFIAKDYVEVPAGHLPDKKTIGSDIYVAGGTSWDNITYVYTKIKDPQPVVSTYVDTQGNVISESISITGDLGTAYTTTAKTIPGYTLAKVDGATSGKYTETKQEVIYTYIKDATYEFKDAYLDYSANTVISISDLDKQFKIVKNVNLSLLSYENEKLNFKVVGTSLGYQLLGTTQTVSKRIQTKNGTIYYVIEIDDKKYVLHSDAFQSVTTVSDLTQEDELAQYSGVSLDYKGNHLEKMNTVELMLTLGSDYNVYDLLRTNGDATISPFVGTTAGLGIQGSTFNITQEFISNNGSKYYKVIVNDTTLIINAAAFIANS